jgi:hypothetical protein
MHFSIAPADAQSSVARVMIAADQGRADAFDLGADPETSAIAPGDVPCLRNLQGYLPHGWIDVGSQLRIARGPLGALLGPEHPVVQAYLCFLKKYCRLQMRLSLELDHEFGAQLGPPLFNVHVQLDVRNWLVMQMDSAESDTIDPPPHFSSGLEMFETSNNLMWVPSVTSVPAMLSLHMGSQPPRQAGPSSAVPRARAAPNAVGPSAAASAAGAAGREPGRMVRNIQQDSRFTTNTPLARNVRARRVAEAIPQAGGPPPDVLRGGLMGAMCVSLHGKGQCFDNCGRVADHGPLTPEESAAFHTWCDRAYA